jgi:hypothetical protein
MSPSTAEHEQVPGHWLLANHVARHVEPTRQPPCAYPRDQPRGTPSPTAEGSTWTHRERLHQAEEQLARNPKLPPRRCRHLHDGARAPRFERRQAKGRCQPHGRIRLLHTWAPRGARPGNQLHPLHAGTGRGACTCPAPRPPDAPRIQTGTARKLVRSQAARVERGQDGTDVGCAPALGKVVEVRKGRMGRHGRVAGESGENRTPPPPSHRTCGATASGVPGHRHQMACTGQPRRSSWSAMRPRS